MSVIVPNEQANHWTNMTILNNEFLNRFRKGFYIILGMLTHLLYIAQPWPWRPLGAWSRLRLQFGIYSCLAVGYSYIIKTATYYIMFCQQNCIFGSLKILQKNERILGVNSLCDNKNDLVHMYQNYPKYSPGWG